MVSTLNLLFILGLSIFFCSIIISLLVGPYSDKYGRRPLLLIPLLGFIVAQIIYLVNVYYWVRMARMKVGIIFIDIFSRMQVRITC